MVLFVVCLSEQRLTVDVIALLGLVRTGPTLVHVRELLLHVLGGKHVDVLNAQRLHDVLLDEVIQTVAGGTLRDNTSPIDVDLPGPLEENLLRT